MFIHIELSARASVLGNATVKPGGGSKIPVRAAVVSRLRERSSAQSSVSGNIGIGLNATDGRTERKNTTARKPTLSKNWADAVSNVETPIAECWTWIISIRPKSCARRTGNIQRQSGSNSGGRKWTTFNCFAPTAIGSRHGSSLGPDMFLEAERRKPEQLSMLGEDAT